MEPESPPSEPSDDDPQPPSTTTTTTTTTEQQQQQTTTNSPRSYECNYCKRGFTNAQALGGHMNIHRKDKTKFKHSSTTVEPPSATRPRLNPSTTTATTAGNLQPLPLFDHREAAVRANIRHPGDPLSPEGDVDLELRLGHGEPPPEPSSENTTTTRKFF